MFLRTMLHFINVNINIIWTAGPSEHLSAADIHITEAILEDDLPLDKGQAKGAGGMEVDNEIIIEMEGIAARLSVLRVKGSFSLVR